MYMYTCTMATYGTCMIFPFCSLTVGWIHHNCRGQTDWPQIHMCTSRMATYIKLKTWRWELSMAKTTTVFTSVPKGLNISLQATCTCSLLPYRLHHPSYKSWGKTEQEVTFEQYQSLMCRSWKQAHDFYVSSSVSKVLLRNNISEK